MQFFDKSSTESNSIVRYRWDFGLANINDSLGSGFSGEKNPGFKFTNAGKHLVRLSVFTDKGCFADTIREVMVVGLAKAQFTFDAKQLCSNNPLQLNNNSFTDTGFLSKVEIYWDFQSDLSNVNLIYSPAQGQVLLGRYQNIYNKPRKAYLKLIATSGQSCVDELIDSILLLPIPKIDTIEVKPICINEQPFQITSASETTGLHGKFSFSGRGVLEEQKFAPNLSEIGNHSIGYLYTAANGCSVDGAFVYSVVSVPIANAGSDLQIREGEEVRLFGKSDLSNVEYRWFPPDYLNNSTIADPIARPPFTKNYRLQVTSNYGCSNTDEVIIRVINHLSIPNAFSPNGDGINDFWQIKHVNQYNDIKIQVFDRYGALVFSIRNQYKPWDGTRNGKTLPAGIYYYKIESLQLVKPLLGGITLLK
jgi:gliding motility-associated-like protein